MRHLLRDVPRWILTIGCVAPIALFLAVAYRLLGGSLDEAMGFTAPGNALTPDVLRADRWSQLWSMQTPTVLLVVCLVAVLVPAGLVVAERPAHLVPRDTSRWVAFGGAVATSLTGVAGLAGFVAQLFGYFPVAFWSGYSQLVAFGPNAVICLLLAVVSGCAATVLLPRASVEAETAPTEEDVVAVDEPAEPVPGPIPSPVPVPTPGMPTLSASDAALYRRT